MRPETPLSDGASMSNSLQSLDTASTLTACEEDRPFSYDNRPAIQFLTGSSINILNLDIMQSRAAFAAHGTSAVAKLLLAQRDELHRNAVSDASKADAHTSAHAQAAIYEMLHHLQFAHNYDPGVHDHIRSILLACIASGCTELLKQSLLFKFLLRDITTLIEDLRRFSRSITLISTLTKRPGNYSRLLASQAFANFGIKLSLDQVHQWIDDFVIDLVCTMHGTTDFPTAQIQLIQTQLMDNATLAFVSYHADKLDGPLRDVELHCVSLSSTYWPSAIAVEEAHYNKLPCQKEIAPLVKILATPPTASTALSAVVTTIINIIERRRRRPRKHNIAPYLWLAAYLACDSEEAARLLFAGGIVCSVRALYESDLAIGNESAERSSLTADPLAMRDLDVISYALLRVLSKNLPASTLALDDRAASELQTLKDDMRQDIQFRSRVSSERYHYWCYWDEIEAENRDRVFLQGLGP